MTSIDALSAHLAVLNGILVRLQEEQVRTNDAVHELAFRLEIAALLLVVAVGLLLGLAWMTYTLHRRLADLLDDLAYDDPEPEEDEQP